MLETNKSSRIELRIGDRLAQIILKNPPLNVIDIPMVEELAQAIARVDAQPQSVILLITGDGKSFPRVRTLPLTHRTRCGRCSRSFTR